jgi:hypothetical protein
MPPVAAAIAAAATAAGNFAAGVVLAEAGLGAAGAAGLVGTVVTATVEVGLYAGIAFATNALFGPKPPPQAAVANPYKQSMPARQSGFGRTRISGPYMLFEAVKGHAFLVIALHDGEIDAFEALYLNDDLCVIDGVTGGVYSPDNPDRYGGGPPGHKIHAETRVGLIPSPVNSFAFHPDINTYWPSTARLDGVAQLTLHVEQSKQKDQQHDFPNGLPQGSVVGRLQKVFDPRLGESQADETTYAWSSNPFLALLKYLTNAPGGMGLDYARRIAPTLAYWTAAANDCDLSMALLAGGTEPRYACGGIYSHATAPADVISQLLQSCDGWLSQRGDGALVPFSGRYVEPTVVFRDEHVTAVTVQHYQPDEQSTNELIPSYSDPNSKYNKVDAGAWRDEADIAARGVDRSENLDLPWVQSPSQARRLAKRKMSRLTAELRGTVTTNLYGMVGLGERYIRLRLSEIDAPVEVSNVEIDLAGMKVTYTWVQADPDIDAWNRFAEEQPPNPGPGPMAGSSLLGPVISAAIAIFDQSSSSDMGARLKLTVDAPIDSNVEWRVRWKPSTSSDWTEATYSDVPDGSSVDIVTGFVPATGDVDVQTAYVTAGGTSPWSATSTVTPATPTTTFTDAVGGALVGGSGVTITDNLDGTFTVASSAGGTTASITASEALAAGDLVSLHTVSGAVKMRKANATDTTKPAHGFVKAAVASGASGTFYGPGQVNDAVSGLTPGATYWLSTTGGGVSTSAPSTSGNGDQEVGQALAAGQLLFMPKMMIEAP